MAIVAVPGGTGNVGRAIVDAIVATGKHQVKILSRKANPELEAEIGVPIIPVDFRDVDALVKVLEEHHIDTVVSAIAMHNVGDDAPNELELIRAADRSRVTRRIISSEWGTDVQEDQVGLIPSTLHKVNAKKELEKTTSLEYTRFHLGYFADYWAFPKVPSYLSRTPIVFWVDIPNNSAAIPGTGDVPAMFTHSTDLAKYVAASLDLPKWEADYFVYGDRLTWNEFVRLAEEAKGVKFNTVHDPLDKLKRGEITELPGQVPLYSFFPKHLMQGMGAAFGMWFETGVFDLKPKDGKFLNETFPEIKPMTVREILNKAWKE